MLMDASSPLDRGQDLDAGAAGQHGLLPRPPPHDLAVDGDGDAARVERDAEQRHGVGHGRTIGELMPFAVDLHGDHVVTASRAKRSAPNEAAALGSSSPPSVAASASPTIGASRIP